MPGEHGERTLGERVLQQTREELDVLEVAEPVFPSLLEKLTRLERASLLSMFEKADEIRARIRAKIEASVKAV